VVPYSHCDFHVFSGEGGTACGSWGGGRGIGWRLGEWSQVLGMGWGDWWLVRGGEGGNRQGALSRAQKVLTKAAWVSAIVEPPQLRGGRGGWWEWEGVSWWWCTWVVVYLSALVMLVDLGQGLLLLGCRM
jgi:hypothetical protein